MDLNKIDSKKLFQKALKLKGKIQLFEEYIEYYDDILIQATEEKKAFRLQKQKEQLDALRFYINNFDEVKQILLDGVIKEKSDEFNLAYRKTREENKRKIEAFKEQKRISLGISDVDSDPEVLSLSKELDDVLASVANDVKAQIKVYKQETFDKAKEEREKADVELVKAKYDELVHKFDKENEAFEAKQEATNKEKVAKNTAKMQAKIAKLQNELDKVNAVLNEISLIKTKNSPLVGDEILKLEHLCMYFGGLHAVEDLSLSVKDGEIYGLIGPNGAGKTTVFNCITQFYKPTSGEITFKTRENDIVNLKEEKVHNVVTLGIARTFQNVEVIGEVSVLENMLIAANRQYQSNLFDHALHTRLLRLEEEVITQRALKILTFMGLLPYAYMLAAGLPYGILKKIEIARTLIANPRLIILDEPAAGLNDSETKDLAKLIRTIRDTFKCTILLVEHDMGLVMDICDRICAISFGKLLCIGTPKEIQANKAVQEAYLGVSE